jgi:hypothetical protein
VRVTTVGWIAGEVVVTIRCLSVADALTVIGNDLEMQKEAAAEYREAMMKAVSPKGKKGKSTQSNVGVTAEIVKILKGGELTTNEIRDALASTPFKGYPTKNIAASLSSLEKSKRVRRDSSEEPNRWSLVKGKPS